MNPPSLKTEEEFKAWAFTHHAECLATHDRQKTTNADVERRLRQLETRVLVLCVLGSVSGSVISHFLF